MISSLLLAYYLNSFTVNEEPPLSVRTYRELRTSEHHSSLDVTVVPIEGGTVPPGSGRVDVMEIKLKAKCGGADVSLKSITLQRQGMGDYRDIERVYLMHGQTRLSPGQSFNRRDGWITLRVRSFDIPACEERIVHVKADFSSSAQNAGEHRFALHDSGDIVASASNVSVFKKESIVRSNMKDVPAANGVLKIGGEKAGEVSVEYLDLTRRITYGPKRTVARFLIRSDSLDDHRIHAITMTNEGLAEDTDLQNLSLPGSDAARYMEGNRVRLIFDPPLILKKNQERLLIMKADVRASRRKTIQFVIEEPSDIEAEIVR